MTDNKTPRQITEYQIGIFPLNLYDVKDYDELGEAIKLEMGLKNTLVLPQPAGSVPRLTVVTNDGRLEVQVSPEKMNLILRNSNQMNPISLDIFIQEVNKFINISKFKSLEIARTGFVTNSITPVNDEFKAFSKQLLKSNLVEKVVNVGAVIDYSFKEDDINKFMRVALEAVQSAENQDKAIRSQIDISNSEESPLKIQLSEITDVFTKLVESNFLDDKIKKLGI